MHTRYGSEKWKHDLQFTDNLKEFQASQLKHFTALMTLVHLKQIQSAGIVWDASLL